MRTRVERYTLSVTECACCHRPSGKIWPRLAMRCRLALKRELPQTCCTECGAAGYNATVANGRCNKVIGEERCHGINQRATNIADWEECASCRACRRFVQRSGCHISRMPDHNRTRRSLRAISLPAPKP